MFWVLVFNNNTFEAIEYPRRVTKIISTLNVGHVTPGPSELSSRPEPLFLIGFTRPSVRCWDSAVSPQ